MATVDWSGTVMWVPRSCTIVGARRVTSTATTGSYDACIPGGTAVVIVEGPTWDDNLDEYRWVVLTPDGSLYSCESAHINLFVPFTP